MPNLPLNQSQHDKKLGFKKQIERKPRGKTPFDSFYSSRRWQRLRSAYRKRNPLCEDCRAKGKITAAKMVHHIVALDDGGSKTNWNNLRSLCNDCHESKHERFKR